MSDLAAILTPFHGEFTNTRNTRPYTTAEIVRRMPRGLKNRLTHDETDVNTWPESTLEMLANLDAIEPAKSSKKSVQWAWTKNGSNARRDLRRNWERIA